MTIEKTDRSPRTLMELTAEGMERVTDGLAHVAEQQGATPQFARTLAEAWRKGPHDLTVQITVDKTRGGRPDTRSTRVLVDARAEGSQVPYRVAEARVRDLVDEDGKPIDAMHGPPHGISSSSSRAHPMTCPGCSAATRLDGGVTVAYDREHGRRYGHFHRKERARRVPIVARGQTPCARCGELITASGTSTTCLRGARLRLTPRATSPSPGSAVRPRSCRTGHGDRGEDGRCSADRASARDVTRTRPWPVATPRTMTSTGGPARRTRNDRARIRSCAVSVAAMDRTAGRGRRWRAAGFSRDRRRERARFFLT
ncbi:hypothetical protein GCM10023215_02340 [Pseudonocardia yuanmonensis]|uniref:Uncharacterized protein n=1 Tax=Pseudonocardia yuanmonensis TaxID=1095914 RepID=A0ABP8VX98_9PSEU